MKLFFIFEFVVVMGFVLWFVLGAEGQHAVLALLAGH